MKKNIFCIVGKSAVGKDTIVDRMCKNFGYSKVKSYTTRSPREHDPKDLQSHIFSTKEAYMEDRRFHDIVADTFFDGNYYWVTSDLLDNDVDFYIVDFAGLKKLKKIYKDKNIISVYITADDKIIKKRIYRREKDKEKANQRIENDRHMFAGANEYNWDYVITNNGKESIDEICDEFNIFITEKNGFAWWE